jgi:hypothetical protein
MGGDAETHRSRFWNRVLGTSYPSAPWDAYWKNVNGICNFFWIKYRYGRPSALSFAGMVATYAVKTLMFDRRPLRRLPWVLRAARAGRRGEVIGMTPERWAELTSQSRT